MDLSELRTTTDGRVRQRYEQVAALVAREILRGAFAAGERLPSERDLATRFAVGRSSVREALAVLQVHGVLETRRGAGSFVAADAVERLGDPGAAALLAGEDAAADASPSALLDARLALEPAVARLAAEASAGPDAQLDELLELMAHAAASTVPDDDDATAEWNDADRLFHRRLADLTGNPVLTAMADYVAALMDQPLWRRVRDESVVEPGRTQVHLAEHRLIAEAIAAGEADAAELYARHHLQRVRRYMTLDRP
jgi:DNA-binding FadR family transcriptional regulator